MQLANAFAWAAAPVSSSATVAVTYLRRPVPVVAGPEGAGLSAMDVAGLFAVNAETTATMQAEVYPQSVASGDPQAQGIVLWTRIAPTARGGVFADRVAWEIATDARFTEGSVVVAGVAPVSSATDNTVKLPIAHAALASSTVYYYRFVYNGVASRTGRFKTLPAAGAELASLRLAYVVCQDYGNGFYTALAHLAEEEVDYVIHLGDYIYETITSTAFQTSPVRMVPPFPSGSTTIPTGLEDYRHLYRVYKSDVHQQAVHERFAYIQLWDDHEFANDCHQDFHPDANTAPDTAATAQPALRQAANQAWSEYGLADVVFDAEQGWERSVQVYRKFEMGGLADVIVTDERLYRDGPPCGSKGFGERYFSVGCPEILDAQRTMLGAEQKQWFLEQMTGSRATWKLWANEVMLMQLKAVAVYVDLDQWDGYGEERKEILNALHAAGVTNLVAITGDLHTFTAGYLKPNFDNPFSPTVGVELMVGSLTSANFEEEILSDVHLSSAAIPAKHFKVPPNLLEPLIRGLNPHIHYWDSSCHGYAVLTITPDALRCEFKAVDTIREPVANLVALKTFTVPAGKVLLQS